MFFQAFSSTFFDETFFQKKALDKLFLKVNYQKFDPVSALTVNSDQAEFSLPAWKSASVYMLDKTYAKVGIKLTKKSDRNAAPDAATNISFANVS
jgi:hypothetical protein